MAKMFEDAFRSIGILEDDDPPHVAQSVLEVIDIRKPKRPKADVARGASQDESLEDYLTITIIPYVNTHSSA